MDHLQPVAWGQGMFLQPEHFQQQDLYHDARLRRLAQMLLPFPWGVKRLRVSEPALETFSFEVDDCEVVTPDGTILAFGGESEAKLAVRSFKDRLDPHGRPLGVYVGVPRLDESASNVATDGSMARGRALRFRSDDREVVDLHSARAHRCAVSFLVADAQILFDGPGERPPDGFEMVKIAEILPSAEGRGGFLSPDYAPPMVAIGASNLLRSLLRDLAKQLLAKSNEFAEYKPKRTGVGVELASHSLDVTLKLQTLNRYVPYLLHAVEVGDVHPVTVYPALRQLVAELSVFSSTTGALGERSGEDALPPYRHQDPLPCFRLAVRSIQALVSEFGESTKEFIPLVHDGQFFAASIEERLLTGDNGYYLAVKSREPVETLHKLLQEKGKISSREEMAKIQYALVPGLKLDVLDVFPEELPKREGFRYFAVDQGSAHWRRIREQRNVVVFANSLPPATEMQLIIIFGH